MSFTSHSKGNRFRASFLVAQEATELSVFVLLGDGHGQRADQWLGAASPGRGCLVDHLILANS